MAAAPIVRLPRICRAKKRLDVGREKGPHSSWVRYRRGSLGPRNRLRRVPEALARESSAYADSQAEGTGRMYRLVSLPKRTRKSRR